MLVPAWDTRTGKKLPNLVPVAWLQKKLFPYLVGSAEEATQGPKEA